ncbi:MAG: YceI family protein [Flavobacteriales bacterium]|nr:YceI family protein [Flavobacteriales bacterium]
MENIDAVNKGVKALINTKNGEVAFIVANIDFHFEKPLMEEHFNENYMESDKYKTSVYKGKMYGDIDFKKDGKYPVTSKGTLKMHGVEKEREIKGIITIKGGKISLKSEFDVKLSDHNIKIPKMVMKKIAETIKVTVNMSFEPKK